jgi:UDP-N-acetylglucosamine transferase subunit ALG13
VTTLFVAAAGGHLDQLDQLSGRLAGGGEPSLWVTSANEQSRSLLADRDSVFVPYVGVRDLRGVLRCIPEARRLRRGHAITRAVSTGSGIALGFLPYLAAHGVECHYIESAARVGGPSVTGRILGCMPHLRAYTQHACWSNDRWRHIGSVFDAFERHPASVRREEALRVVVTLGTATEFPFRRLVEALVPILAPGGELERATGAPVEVLWQTGGTPVDDLPIRATPFTSADALAQALAGADIVVCHAGTGSALGALNAGRLPLVAARRPSHGEAGDDHQHQLAGELDRRGIALARDPEAISVDDLLRTQGIRVRRVERPPPIVLCE